MMPVGAWWSVFDAADGDQAERQLVSLGLRPDDEEYARLRTAGGQLTFSAAIDEALATLERLPAS